VCVCVCVGVGVCGCGCVEERKSEPKHWLKKNFGNKAAIVVVPEHLFYKKECQDK